MKVLVVIDMQNDFIAGALGTVEAQAIVPKVTEKIRGFEGRILQPETPTRRGIWTRRKGKSFRLYIVSGIHQAGRSIRRSPRCSRSSRLISQHSAA